MNLVLSKPLKVVCFRGPCDKRSGLFARNVARAIIFVLKKVFRNKLSRRARLAMIMKWFSQQLNLQLMCVLILSIYKYGLMVSTSRLKLVHKHLTSRSNIVAAAKSAASTGLASARPLAGSYVQKL